MKNKQKSPGVLIAGTSSDVGKSFITAGLLGAARRRGLRVAPFKGINISNNARATADGEVPVAQFVQAIAAGLDPHPRFSPILMKYGGGFRDVVVNGKSNPVYSDMALDSVFKEIEVLVNLAYEDLASSGYDLIIAEGMGALTEPHLSQSSPANLALSDKFDLPMLLIVEASRGGVLPFVIGTLGFLSIEQRSRLAGLIINKVFDANHDSHRRLTAALEREGAIPVVGAVPLTNSQLPAEDSLSLQKTNSKLAKFRVKIIRPPSASNLDEFGPLFNCDGINAQWISGPADLDADLLILPGCRDVVAALAWLRSTGLAEALVSQFKKGNRIIGICGGAQMLSRAIYNAEARSNNVDGLSLIEASVISNPEKIIGNKTVKFMGFSSEKWNICQMDVDVYEIHHGIILLDNDRGAISMVNGFLFSGPILATIFHGIFENARFFTALTGLSYPGTLRRAIDDVIDIVEDNVNIESIFGKLLAQPRS